MTRFHILSIFQIGTFFSELLEALFIHFYAGFLGFSIWSKITGSYWSFAAYGFRYLGFISHRITPPIRFVEFHCGHAWRMNSDWVLYLNKWIHTFPLASRFRLRLLSGWKSHQQFAAGFTKTLLRFDLCQKATRTNTNHVSRNRKLFNIINPFLYIKFIARGFSYQNSG